MCNKLLVIFFILFLAYSCDKPDDFSGKKPNYQYNGSFSLPVGTDTFAIKQLTSLANGSVPISIIRKMPSFSITETFDFNIQSNIGEANRLKSLIVYFEIENYYPFQLTAPLVFLNERNIPIPVLTELNTNVAIKAATFSGNGKISEPHKQILKLTFSKKQCAKLQNAKKLFLQITINNSNNQSIPDEAYINLSKYYIICKLGTNLNFDFNINEN